MTDSLIKIDPEYREPTHRVLVVDHGDHTFDHHRLRGERLIIGRASDADIRLDRGSVSRHHCELFRDPFGRWWVRDLESRNGTRVNGYEISERILELNDIIEVGESKLTMKMPGPEPTAGGKVMGQTGVTMMDSEESVQTLERDPSIHIAAGHLSSLMAMGEKMQATESAADRLDLLCSVLVEPQFHGSTAIVLRVPKMGLDVPPKALSSPRASNGRSVGGSLYISNSLIRAVQRKGVAALASSDPDMGSSVTELSAVSSIAAIACPLRVDDQEIDLLYMTVPTQYGTTEWLNLAALACEQYRLADNAWTARRQMQANAMVEHDLERARDMQMKLLPRDVHVTGLDIAVSFKPCRWVAGDYVDVLEQNDGRTLMVIADVCGKGLPAALVSSSMHTMIRASVRAGADLLDMVEVLNDYFVDYLPNNRFVTAVFVRMDPAGGQFEYINAGHPMPLVIGPGGVSRGLPLSEFEPLGINTTRYTAQHDTLAAGQLLAMYTDGLTEVQDSSGRMLNVVRLGDHITALFANEPHAAAAQLANKLDRILDDYQGSRMQADDRTFLLARRGNM